MGKDKSQHIELSPITCIGRKVDKLEFDSGNSTEDAPESSRSYGSLNITNKIIFTSIEDGERRCQLTMGLEIVPEIDGRYYSIDLTVSGIYSSPTRISDDEFKDALLTFGSADLYSYAKNIAEMLSAGGVWGTLDLPQIGFTVS